MTYIYGKLDGIEGTICSPLFKSAISNATLVYTDDSEIRDNYTKVGVKVLPIKQKRKTKSKSKSIED
jgi:rRNA-processing protein FCF1